MIQQKLSKEQAEATFYNDCEGAVLVEAAAGSGKTRLLTERVRYLLTQKQDNFFSILCLTFTNKAANEMKERLEDIPKLKERVFIGTFHEFCLQNIIRTRYIEIGLQNVPHIFDENDKKEILEEVLIENEIFEDDYVNLSSKEQQHKLYNYLNYISERKRKLDLVTIGNDNDLEEEKKNILYNGYNDRMLSQNAIDYDDILLYAYRILTERGDIIANLYRRLYKYILVDEAQDLNYAQYSIIKTICGENHKNVFMVGDPNQALYGFNDADIKYMKNYFVRDFNAKEFEVKHNYRSSKKVLDLANSLRSKTTTQDCYFTGESKIIGFDNQEEEAKWIIEKIKEWKNKGLYKEKDSKEELNLENIVVLARNRFVFSELLNQLEKDTELSNQFYLRKGMERFKADSLFIKIFDFGLKVISNPSNSLHFNKILSSLNIKLDNSVDRISFLLNIHQHANQNLPLSVSQLELLSDIWGKLNTNPKWLGYAIDRIKNELENLDLQDEDREIVQTDIESLQDYWNEFIRDSNSSNQNIIGFSYYLSLNNSKEDRKGLTLATVHTVKGLEYEIAFLMGANEGVIPDYRATDEKSLNEEKNNLYVAITRAKRCIYVTYPKKRMMPWGSEKVQKISSFLKDINLDN